MVDEKLYQTNETNDEEDSIVDFVIQLLSDLKEKVSWVSIHQKLFFSFVLLNCLNCSLLWASTFDEWKHRWILWLKV